MVHGIVSHDHSSRQWGREARQMWVDRASLLGVFSNTCRPILARWGNVRRMPGKAAEASRDSRAASRNASSRQTQWRRPGPLRWGEQKSVTVCGGDIARKGDVMPQVRSRNRDSNRNVPRALGGACHG
jgi:hypothetical protein